MGDDIDTEVQVQDELGMKTLHNPNRCVHMQQVYMIGDSLLFLLIYSDR